MSISSVYRETPTDVRNNTEYMILLDTDEGYYGHPATYRMVEAQMAALHPDANYILFYTEDLGEYCIIVLSPFYARICDGLCYDAAPLYPHYPQYFCKFKGSHVEVTPIIDTTTTTT